MEGSSPAVVPAGPGSDAAAQAEVQHSGVLQQAGAEANQASAASPAARDVVTAMQQEQQEQQALQQAQPSPLAAQAPGLQHQQSAPRPRAQLPSQQQQPQQSSSTASGLPDATPLVSRGKPPPACRVPGCTEPLRSTYNQVSTAGGVAGR